MLTQLLVSDIPVPELVLRGSLMYWFIFLMFRLVLRRDVGSIGMADILIIVLIADAAQNAMAGGYQSVGAGCVLIGTLIFWNLCIDWLCFRFPRMQRLLEPPAVVLAQNGRIHHQRLRREYISLADFMAKLREKGVDDPGQVRRVTLESDGEISVIQYPEARRQQ